MYLVWTGVGIDIGWGSIMDTLVGLEYRWTVRMVKHEYTCDYRMLMPWICCAAS